MKKVITFSLWGDNPTYNVGSIKNAELAKIHYPDFECWFYIHKESVPKKTIEELVKLNNTKIICKSGDLDNCKPRMWRFEAIDDPEVEIMMSRDTDTRIWEREVISVNAWLKSDKLFHIMRDHPFHKAVIMAGMFGTRKNVKIKSWVDLINQYKQTEDRVYDQLFLFKYIYPIVVNNSVIHDNFNKSERHAVPFEMNYNENYNFVGEYVYSDESRNLQHIEILKDSIKNNRIKNKKK
jgi:protein O-GlcNAc transferase